MFDEIENNDVCDEKHVSPAADLSSFPYVSIVEDKGVKKYFCSKCQVLLSTNTIRRHVLENHIAIKEECPICDEQFKTKVEKRKHLRKNHNLEEIGRGKQKKLGEIQKVSCDECKKELKSNRHLQEHIRNRHSLKKCPDCPSMLPATKMAIHRNDAHGTPIPTCGICGYKNAYKHRVVSHQRQVHLREKRIPCHLCDMTFFSNAFLKRHLIKHKPDKIHECSYCHKKFPRMNTLRMHLKIHKGEKNKVCSLCGERFVQKASLTYHMIKHHPDAC